MKFTVVLLCLILAACASTPSSPPAGAAVSTPTSTASAPLSLKTLTHADLQAAAAYATAHGYPSRAAMYTAIETQLTAAENQIQACKAAIAAALPTSPTVAPPGAFTALEMAAEAVGQGIPASIRITCEPIVVPSGLIPLPKL